jgi:acyl dehydratase
MPAPEIAADQLAQRVGQELGVSDWIEVSQSRIDLFANATLDHQFIHVDPGRAASTVYGGTIAHGFLVLSLLSRMSYDALPAIEKARMSVNYGMNRLRFLSPVKSGEQVRGRFVLNEIESKAGSVRMTWGVTVEIMGGSKPALVAEWLVLAMLDLETS